MNKIHSGTRMCATPAPVPPDELRPTRNTTLTAVPLPSEPLYIIHLFWPATENGEATSVAPAADRHPKRSPTGWQPVTLSWGLRDNLKTHPLNIGPMRYAASQFADGVLT